MEEKLNRLVVISAFYNPGTFLEQCVGSLITQKYSNYHIYFVDDASTDKSMDKLPIGNPNVTVIRNKERRTALENIHFVIMNHCKTDDIVILVDGDDAITKTALSDVNSFFVENNIWLSWGSCIWNSNDGNNVYGKDFSRPYTQEEFKNIRSAPFKISHLRAFVAGLYINGIGKQDPEFKSLKNSEGDFYKSSYDTCIFLSLLELAGFEKSKHNSKKLYIYNLHGANDHVLNQNLQTSIHLEVIKKQPFKQIKDIFTGETY